jgi:transcriptional regulator NrdR family protein
MSKPGLHCPKCGSKLSTVKETREGDDAKRRRRKCHKCGESFWTDERVEQGRER